MKLENSGKHKEKYVLLNLLAKITTVNILVNISLDISIHTYLFLYIYIVLNPSNP